MAHRRWGLARLVCRRVGNEWTRPLVGHRRYVGRDRVFRPHGSRNYQLLAPRVVEIADHGAPRDPVGRRDSVIYPDRPAGPSGLAGDQQLTAGRPCGAKYFSPSVYAERVGSFADAEIVPRWPNTWIRESGVPDRTACYFRSRQVSVEVARFFHRALRARPAQKRKPENRRQRR